MYRPQSIVVRVKMICSEIQPPAMDYSCEFAFRPNICSCIALIGCVGECYFMFFGLFRLVFSIDSIFSSSFLRKTPVGNQNISSVEFMRTFPKIKIIFNYSKPTSNYIFILIQLDSTQCHLNADGSCCNKQNSANKDAKETKAKKQNWSIKFNCTKLKGKWRNRSQFLNIQFFNVQYWIIG